MKYAATHLLMHFLIGVIVVKQASSELKMVHSGTNVSFLCPNLLKEPSYIAWFKQINDSLPVCIVTQYVSENQADSIYFNGFQKNHIVMSANSTFSSLRIISVDVSDSGIFYCGSFLKNQMVFHNKTQLVIENATKDAAIKDFGEDENTLRSCHVFCTLTLILSGLIFLPTVFAIVVFLRLKKIKKQKEDTKYHGKNKDMGKQQQNKEQNEDLNYAALNLDKKNRRPVRSMRTMEPNVVYAATR